jgi:uncharacterized coiled-coil protein SlyX
MNPLLEKLHQAFIQIVIEYVRQKKIDITHLPESHELSAEGGEDFSLVSTLISPAALIPRINSIDDGEIRKSLLIFLLKSAEKFETCEGYDEILPILEHLHALFSLSNHSTRMVSLDDESFILYGFSGWLASQAASLVQQTIFFQVFGIPDAAYSLSWFAMKTIIESNFVPTLTTALAVETMSTPVAAASEMEGASLFTDMQESIIEKDLRIKDIMAKLSEASERLKEQHSRYQSLLEAFKKLESQNKELKGSLVTSSAEIETLKSQLVINQEQLDCQQTEIINLQKKLKDRDKTLPFTTTGIAASPAFGVPRMVGQSSGGMFSGGSTLFADGPRQRKFSSATSPGKK